MSSSKTDSLEGEDKGKEPQEVKEANSSTPNDLLSNYAESASHFGLLRPVPTGSPPLSQHHSISSSAFLNTPVGTLPRYYAGKADVARGIDRGEGGLGPSGKERLRLLLDEPNSSREALMVSICISLTILLSSLLGIIETVPQLYRTQERLWFIFESIIAALFTVEFLLRAYAHSSTNGQFRRFLGNFFTIIDVVALIPFYFGLFLFGDSVSDMQRFTVLRLFRLLRLLRYYTYSSLLQLSIDALMMALKKSTDALLAMMVFISFVIVTFSTLLYFAERGSWDPKRRVFMDKNGYQSQFDSIPAAIWFVAEVTTTVGLGDVYPRTVLGKMITIPLMLFSLLIIALPSIVIGRNFAESWAWLRSTQRPVIRSTATLAPTISSPQSSDRDALSPPPGAPIATLSATRAKETPFMAELSSTQFATHISVDLSEANCHPPLPDPSASIEDHGEVVLGILQELQRQNELLERLLTNQLGLTSSVSSTVSSPQNKKNIIRDITDN